MEGTGRPFHVAPGCDARRGRHGARPAGAGGDGAKGAEWIDRLLDHFLTLAQQSDGSQRLQASLDAVRTTIEQAVEAERYRSGLQLARAAEPAFVASARWGAWLSVLGAALTAARALGDRSAEAWALHELGVRARALDQPARARAYMAEALAIRSADGLKEAAEVTRSQLAALRR